MLRWPPVVSGGPEALVALVALVAPVAGWLGVGWLVVAWLVVPVVG